MVSTIVIRLEVRPVKASTAVIGSIDLQVVEIKRSFVSPMPNFLAKPFRAYRCGSSYSSA